MSYQLSERLRTVDFNLYNRIINRVTENDLEGLMKHLKTWLVWDMFFQGTALTLVPLAWVARGLELAEDTLEYFISTSPKTLARKEPVKPTATQMAQSALDEAGKLGMCWCQVCRDFTHDDPFEGCPACGELVYPVPHAIEQGYIEAA